jgi:perosamine synthetase
MHNRLNNFVDDVDMLLHTTGISHQVHEPSIPIDTSKHLNQCVKSTYFSSQGTFLDKFENELKKFTGSDKIVLTNTGTSALHIALNIIKIDQKEVLVPSMTFIASTNAIIYNNGIPHFVDCEKGKISVDHKALDIYLDKITFIKNKKCFNKNTGREIAGIIIVHGYGHSVDFDSIRRICKKNHLQIIEDAAACLGSFYKDKHLGTLGRMGIISFNGNKIITTGMGGALICKTLSDFRIAKHLVSTAKVPPSHKYIHDKIGYNYRMANINAASGYAQLLNIKKILHKKIQLHKAYIRLISNYDFCDLYQSLPEERPNYWINNIVISSKSKTLKDNLLKRLHYREIYAREIWTPLHLLKMFKSYPHMKLTNSIDIWNRTLSLPSSVKL